MFSVDKMVRGALFAYTPVMAEKNLTLHMQIDSIEEFLSMHGVDCYAPDTALKEEAATNTDNSISLKATRTRSNSLSNCSLHLHTSSSQQVIAVYGDHYRLKQVVTNFVTNGMNML